MRLFKDGDRVMIPSYGTPDDYNLLLFGFLVNLDRLLRSP